MHDAKVKKVNEGSDNYVSKNAHSQLKKVTWIHTNISSSVLITIVELCLLLKASISLFLCSWSWSHHFLSLKIYISHSPFLSCIFKSLIKLNLPHAFKKYSSFITFKNSVLDQVLWELSIKFTPLTQGSFWKFLFILAAPFVHLQLILYLLLYDFHPYHYT